MATAVAENLARVRERIGTALARSGRGGQEVHLVAVSKGQPASAIREAVSAGVRAIGESRVQEARSKFPALSDLSVERHLVGHLQRNKVRHALPLFDVVQSVDSLRLASALSERAVLEAERSERESSASILVEINISGEAQKYGFPPEGALDRIEEIAALPGLKVLGLMTIGPLSGDESAVRAAFQRLHRLYEDLSRSVPDAVEARYLSMGMTDDFEWALEEGANMVRIGRGIFGPREG